jgi:hypothetical protein
LVVHQILGASSHLTDNGIMSLSQGSMESNIH